MTKYDFGYELQQGSTNEWAFHAVTRGADVLELGAAVGTLTRHLAQDKQCRVDIIEIDEEAGARAAQYADLALTGQKGDLNGTMWLEELTEKKRRYDEIVILDVLEHLQNPERTLQLAKTLLKETGKMVLSIPNAAHNSVLINAFRNKFEYTQLGLLDCTHIHLFAYEDIVKMLQRLELHIYLLDAVIKAVGTNEIVNGYDSLPAGMQYYLRTRKHAEVYQYLITAGMESKNTYDRIQAGISERSLYASIILVNGLGKNEIVTWSTLEAIEVRINLQNYGRVHDIRFFPVRHRCIVRELTAYGRAGNQMVRITPNWTGGIQIGEEDFIFTEENGEINFAVSETYDMFYISCTCSLIDETSAEMFLKSRELLSSVEQELEAEKKRLEVLEAEKKRLAASEADRTRLEATNQILKEEKQQSELISQTLQEDKKELCTQNKQLQEEVKNLRMQAERLEAELCKYRKSWYIRLRARMRHDTEEK